VLLLNQLGSRLFGTYFAVEFAGGGLKHMEFVTITAKSDGHSYVAIYRKWFSENLGAWELELVPNTPVVD
jgi:hypothetical protein